MCILVASAALSRQRIIHTSHPRTLIIFYFFYSFQRMGVSLFLGCLLTALGPVSVVFLLVVAPHANLVVLTILR